MKFYKILRKDLRSFNGSSESCRSILYKRRSWNKPIIEGSKLFIFRTLTSLKSFMDRLEVSLSWYRIFECEVKNPKKKDSILDCDDYITQGTIQRFFKGLSLESDSVTIAPEGTYVCDELRLLKRVKMIRKNYEYHVQA